MGLRDWYRRAFVPDDEERTGDAMSFQQFVDWFSYAGHIYDLSGGTGIAGNREEIGPGFEHFVGGSLKRNGIVFTCMAIRLRVFSDVRFNFRELNNGRPGKLYGGIDGRNPASKGLKLLNEPEPGMTTGDLLAHMIQDVDLSGNAFVLRRGDRLIRLRPDWVTIAYGSRRQGGTAWDLDSELLGYLYQPGGPENSAHPIRLLPEEVAHWAPMPDPISPRRGMSWLTPIMREISSDSAATSHKEKFFLNDATINNVMEFEPGVTKELFDYAKASFNEQHQGVQNAYKTLFLLGAKMHNIGVDFKQMDFKAVQGAMETRIASASGVHPVLAAFSEGLQGSSLNAGNFQSARRSTADITFRPLWRNLCGSLAHIIETPADAELWYDDRDCMFLQEDRKDAADIQYIQAQSIRQLVDGGYKPETVVSAVMSEDMSLLKHMGLMSVQLLPPGTKSTPELPPPPPEPPAEKSEVVDLVARSKSEAAYSMAEMAFTQQAVRQAVQESLPGIRDVNVDVAAPQITLPEVRIEPAQVNITTPEVQANIEVHAAEAPNVTVEPAVVNVPVTVPELAPHIEVHAAPTPEVHVTPEITVESTEVHVAAPEVRVEPRIEVAAAPTPEVHVEAPVTVNVPDAPKRKLKVKRDRKGVIEGVEEE